MKKLILSIFVSATILMMPSCGSAKKAAQSNGDVEISVPFSTSEYLPDAEHFRASAVGISNSQEIASQKALTAARAKLAASIESTVKTVTDNFTSSYEQNTQEEARGKFMSLTREIVNQRLSGAKVIGQKMMKTPENQYKSYVAVELAAEDLVKAMESGISNDSKLRTDFEYEKYKKTFEAEMAKFENQ